MLFNSLLALGLAAAPAFADPLGGQIVQVGNTLVSAMMVRRLSVFGSVFSLSLNTLLQMFVGGTNKVYILDKVEGNAQKINGHSLYASVWCVCYLFFRTVLPALMFNVQK